MWCAMRGPEEHPPPAGAAPSVRRKHLELTPPPPPDVPWGVPVAYHQPLRAHKQQGQAPETGRVPEKGTGTGGLVPGGGRHAQGLWQGHGVPQSAHAGAPQGQWCGQGQGMVQGQQGYCSPGWHPNSPLSFSPVYNSPQSLDTFHLPASSSAASSPGGAWYNTRSNSTASANSNVNSHSYGGYAGAQSPGANATWHSLEVLCTLDMRSSDVLSAAVVQPGTPGAVPLPLDPHHSLSILRMACDLPQSGWDEILDLLKQGTPAAELRYTLQNLQKFRWPMVYPTVGGMRLWYLLKQGAPRVELRYT